MVLSVASLQSFNPFSATPRSSWLLLPKFALGLQLLHLALVGAQFLEREPRTSECLLELALILQAFCRRCPRCRLRQSQRLNCQRRLLSSTRWYQHLWLNCAATKL